MLIALQNILFCLLFISLVKCAARNNGLNCLYFYPKEYIEEAHKRGLATIMYLVLAFAVGCFGKSFSPVMKKSRSHTNR